MMTQSHPQVSIPSARSFVRWARQALLGVVAIGMLSGAPLAATNPPPTVCIDGIEGPATREGFEGCFEPSAYEFRHAQTLRADGGGSETRLRMVVKSEEADIIRDHISDPDDPQVAELTVCVYEGANICPEPKFKVVFPCITIGMLAGKTCPVVETDDGRVIVDLISGSTN